MICDRRSFLSDNVNGLLSAGRTVFTAEEAEQALGVGRGAFLDAAERLQRRNVLLNPRQDSTWSSHRNTLHGERRRRPGISTRSCVERASATTSDSSRRRSSTVRRTRPSWSFRWWRANGSPRSVPAAIWIVFLLSQGHGSGRRGDRGSQDRYRHDEDLVGRADRSGSAPLPAGIRRYRQRGYCPLRPWTEDRRRSARRPFGACGAAGRAEARTLA